MGLGVGLNALKECWGAQKVAMIVLVVLGSVQSALIPSILASGSCRHSLKSTHGGVASPCPCHTVLGSSWLKQFLAALVSSCLPCSCCFQSALHSSSRG